MDTAISIRALSKSFGRLRALDGVTFDVPARSICGLVGPNGAGKTTLLSIVANFLKSSAGAIEVLGIDVRRISALRGRMSILPQDAAFQRNIPILEQLVFFRLLDGQTRPQAEEEVRHALEMVGLAERARRGTGSLSHGMIKRLGVAQAFLGQPEVILLDEPTAGLDPKGARQIRDLIRTLRAGRSTIVISSHNLDEIQEISDHVAILDRGRLVTFGTVAEITQTGREINLRLSRDLSDEETASLLALPGIAAITQTDPQRYTVVVDASGADFDLDQILSNLQRQLLDMGITPRAVAEGRSLESQFLRLTGREGEQL